MRGILEPVRYRAILKTKNPRKLVNSLESVGVKSIIPTEDWELLGQWEFLPNALKFSHETISIPIYPSLTKEHLDIILSGSSYQMTFSKEWNLVYKKNLQIK